MTAPKPGSTYPRNRRSRYKRPATYFAAHRRVDRDRGPARTHACAGNCGRRAQEWAYRGGCPDEQWGTNHANGKAFFCAYTLDQSRYDPLCKKCHAGQRIPLLAMLAERITEKLDAAA